MRNERDYPRIFKWTFMHGWQCPLYNGILEVWSQIWLDKCSIQIILPGLLMSKKCASHFWREINYKGTCQRGTPENTQKVFLRIIRNKQTESIESRSFTYRGFVMTIKNDMKSSTVIISSISLSIHLISFVTTPRLDQI